MGESICWGYITAEDKTPPVVPTKVYVPVACGDLDIILANSERDKVRKLGSGDECVFPMFGNAGFYTSWDLIRDKAYFNINKDVFDACSDYCDLKFQINDLKMEGDICAEDAADRPMVVRTVKVTDEKGNSAAFEIWFYENQPEFVPGCKDVNGDAGHEGFYLYEDISCYMNTEIDLCLGDHAVKGSFYYYSCWYDVVDGKLVQREVRPSFTATDNGGTASFCGYAATYVDVKIPIEDDCGYKITRSWTLLDWCVEDPFRKIFEKDQLIKKGYFSPLEVTPPAIGDKDGMYPLVPLIVQQAGYLVLQVS
jgi:ssDNA-binding Zn-finger/Zn-ribbon topoisomerase 1